jgi:hypothetical protein
LSLSLVFSANEGQRTRGNARIAQQQATMQYFGADAIGSVRQMYNASGQIVFNKRYDPYGNRISQSGAGASA